MNTKSLPAVLALIAGFVICIMSFVQHVDTVVFAKRFVVVCIIFFAIGTVASVVIRMNFKDMSEEEEEQQEEDSLEEEEEEDGTKENTEEDA